MPASAIDWSAVGPNDAPVYKLTLKSSVLPRSANANGNSFGSPNNVNPLIPKFIPALIQEAASSADTIISANALFRINSLKSLLIKHHLIYKNYTLRSNLY